MDNNGKSGAVKELAVKGTAALSQVSFDDVVITKEDVRNYLCPEATDKEVFMAMGIMASYKLNPFKREVHLIKYKGSPAEVVVGYETYLKRADRTGKLKGWKAGISQDGKQAWVKIWRTDWTEPFEWEVELKEFDKKRATWTQIPTFMAKKVAIAQGFRLAFPDDIGGLPYTKEEHEAYEVTATMEAEKKPDLMPKALPKPELGPVEAVKTEPDEPKQVDDKPAETTANTATVYIASMAKSSRKNSDGKIVPVIIAKTTGKDSFYTYDIALAEGLKEFQSAGVPVMVEFADDDNGHRILKIEEGSDAN